MQPLAVQIPASGLPRPQLLALAHALLRRVAVDHDAGETHDDLRPESILWDGADRVELPDSGAEPAPSPAWMAPEQIGGELSGPAGDVFVLGSILYLAATGAHPFAGPTPEETLANMQTLEPPRPSTQRPDLGPGWDAAIMACLDQEPRARPASAGAALRLLDANLRAADAPAHGRPAAPVAAAATGAADTVTSRPGAHLAVVWAAALVAGALLVWWWNSRRAGAG